MNKINFTCSGHLYILTINGKEYAGMFGGDSSLHDVDALRIDSIKIILDSVAEGL